jgi:thiol-disulfide isomerase/thioredoxin
MKATLRLLAGLAALAATATPGAADGPKEADGPPRYRFQPGQEIAFRGSSSFRYGEGDNAGSLDHRSDWTVWVLRANSDGSFRLAVRERNAFTQTFGKNKNEQPPRTTLVYADVFPDGRVLPNSTIRYHGHPDALFPVLPENAAAAKTGWTATRDGRKTSCKPVEGAGGWCFEAITEAPEDKIYLSTHKAKHTFDPARGLVTRSETATTQGYGFNGKGTGSTELVEVKKVEGEALKQLVADAERCFTALEAYEKVTEDAGRAAPEKAKSLLEGALENLKAAPAQVGNADLKAQLEERIKNHEQLAKYTLDDAERRAKHMGQPAHPFDTTDLDGKKVRLADLRGKVVVLDFWYRGCGWCVKAMPQMNQLADDFAGKPVAILGMNTDRKEEDARFVIDKMGLKYPTLKAEGLPAKFGVQGFPTLIVIDQEGKVHDIHVGYSPTLRDDVGKVIRGLLDRK